MTNPKSTRNQKEQDVDFAQNDEGSVDQSVIEQVPKVVIDQSILERVHKAMTKAVQLSKRDIAWQGTIQTNKDTVVEVYYYNKKEIINIKGGKPLYNCDIRVLQQLVLRAVQEGCADKKYDWNATGTPNTENPLEITILEHSGRNSQNETRQLNVPMP